MKILLPFLFAFCAAYVLVSRHLSRPVRCDGGIERWIDRVEAAAVHSPTER
jgi:hypothetical protein